MDPDGSRADMGAYSFFHPVLRLPSTSARPGGLAIVRITGSVERAYSVDLTFTVNSTIATPAPDFVRGHLFQERLDASVEWNVIGDTVFVTLATGQPVSVLNDVIAELAFVVDPDAPLGSTPISWNAELTNVNEASVYLVDGSLNVSKVHYGDVSNDGQITSYDASLILQYVVRLIDWIDPECADVTGNGKVTGYDAAHVLYKVIDTSYVFPAAGGWPLPKPAVAPMRLSWVPDGSGWALVVDGAPDMLGGEMTLSLPSGLSANVTGSNAVAFKQDGRTLRVAFTKFGGDDRTLFRLRSKTPILRAPIVIAANVNDEEITVAAQPLKLSLEQNAPNPFNPTTALRFSTPDAGVVSLAIYDVNGRLVRTLVAGPVEAGAHEVVWDGRDALGREVSSGVYLYRLTYTGRTPSEQETTVRRMVLVR